MATCSPRPTGRSYTYEKDTKGGTPTCTGSCAAIWPPLTGNPVASAADTGLGTLGTVSDASGAKQVTYNGKPPYTFKGAKSLYTNGNGVGGVWHVITMSRATSPAADHLSPKAPAFPGRSR